MSVYLSPYTDIEARVVQLVGLRKVLDYVCVRRGSNLVRMFADIQIGLFAVAQALIRCEVLVALRDFDVGISYILSQLGKMEKY